MVRNQLSSTHLLSNPIGSLSKLLFTQQAFINDFNFKVNGLKKDLNQDLIARALERFDDKKFTSSLEKYSLYMNAVDESLNRFKNKHVIFLDLLAPTLVSKETNFRRSGVDDFNGLNRFPDYLFEKIYLTASSKVKEALKEEIIFWRLSPYDFPFRFDEVKGTPIIRNLFEEEGKEISDYLSAKNKSTLGNQSRLYKEHMAIGNYKFSPALYSVMSFRKNLRLAGGLELLMSSYKKVYGDITREEFIKRAEGSARINYALLKEKYKNIISRLEPNKTTAYMLKSTKSYDLLSSIQDIEIPGNGLTSPARTISFSGELGDAAFGRLAGYLRALYDPTGPLPKIDTEKKTTILEEGRSQVYPYSINLVKSDIDTSFEKYDLNSRLFLENDVRNYQFGVQSMESILYDLNTHDYKVILPDGRIGRLRELVGESKIQPFDVRGIRRGERGLTRPSNSSGKCEISFVLSMKEENFWPNEIKNNKASQSGLALHHLGNEVSTNQKKYLSTIGLKPLSRTAYCEVPLCYEFNLTNKQWNNFEDLIDLKIANTENDFYKELKKYYIDARNKNISFKDGGSPDGVLMIENEKAPMIVDFKRRMSLFYPVQSFFTQISRYALALKHNIKDIGDHFYLNIVQRPFSPNQFLGREANIDSGIYRKPTQVIKRVDYDSEYIDSVYERVAFETLCAKLINEKPEIALNLRTIYNSKLKNSKVSCDNCFSNQQEDFKCNYLFTGKKTPWED